VARGLVEEVGVELAVKVGVAVSDNVRVDLMVVLRSPEREGKFERPGPLTPFIRMRKQAPKGASS
jgi:hypothetical protein